MGKMVLVSVNGKFVYQPHGIAARTLCEAATEGNIEMVVSRVALVVAPLTDMLEVKYLNIAILGKSDKGPMYRDLDVIHCFEFDPDGELVQHHTFVPLSTHTISTIGGAGWNEITSWTPEKEGSLK